MYIDTCVETKEINADLIKIAKKLGYVTLAIEGLTKYKEVEGIKLIPRKTYTNLEIPQGIRGHIKVLEIRNIDYLKRKTNIIKRANSIELGYAVLKRLTDKQVRIFQVTKVPVELRIYDIIEVARKGGQLNGLFKLLRYAELGKVEIVLCSGAKDAYELIPPKSIINFMLELGLSEVTVLKALLNVPKHVIRGAGFDT